MVVVIAALVSVMPVVVVIVVVIAALVSVMPVVVVIVVVIAALVSVMPVVIGGGCNSGSNSSIGKCDASGGWWWL